MLFAVVIAVFSSCSKEIEIHTLDSSSDYSEENNEIPIRNTLRVAYSSFGGCFNPFFAEVTSDKNVVSLTHVRLLTFDNNGNVVNNAINGKTNLIDGEEYFFEGIADINTSKNDDGNYIFHIKLRNDLKFSDGNLLDIDDLIFTMYVLCDPGYDGPIIFDTLSIKGLAEYTKNNAEFISGINRIDDYTVDIEMLYMDSRVYDLLSVYIAPLHYYGSDELYDYEKHRFGFMKGDISDIKQKEPAKIGIGPYVFQRYENNIIHLRANIDYFRGSPAISFIELHKVDEAKMLDGLVNDKFDICQPDFNIDAINFVKNANGGTLNGSSIHTFLQEYNGYTYIGINAFNVKVGQFKDSDESKSLRKAFATVFSFYRQSVCQEYYDTSASVINYPISNTSWLAPKPSDEGYKIAFSNSLSGRPIYLDWMTEEEKYSAMLEATREFFMNAGFVFDDETGAFTMAPEGAKLEYSVILPKKHSTLGIFKKAAEALSTIGITLKINEVDDINTLWDALDNHQCEIWAASWKTDLNYDLYQTYHSSNVDEHNNSTGTNDFDIVDALLDSLIMKTKIETNKDELKNLYLRCFDIILDWAVEIPVFQRSDAFLVNATTVDISSYSSTSICKNWYDDIHNLHLIPLAS